MLLYFGVRVQISLSLNSRTLALSRSEDEGCDFHFSALTWGVRGAALGGLDVESSAERARGAGTMPRMGTPVHPVTIRFTVIRRQHARAMALRIGQAIQDCWIERQRHLQQLAPPPFQ